MFGLRGLQKYYQDIDDKNQKRYHLYLITSKLQSEIPKKMIEMSCRSDIFFSFDMKKIKGYDIELNFLAPIEFLKDELCNYLSENHVLLILEMLQIDPNLRITSKNALNALQ